LQTHLTSFPWGVEDALSYAVFFIYSDGIGILFINVRINQFHINFNWECFNLE
jgi:hypothetical protein